MVWDFYIEPKFDEYHINVLYHLEWPLGFSRNIYIFLCIFSTHIFSSSILLIFFGYFLALTAVVGYQLCYVLVVSLCCLLSVGDSYQHPILKLSAHTQSTWTRRRRTISLLGHTDLPTSHQALGSKVRDSTALSRGRSIRSVFDSLACRSMAFRRSYMD